MEKPSWILEIRRRLEAPKLDELPRGGTASAALVLLYVDGGELWTLLRSADGTGPVGWPQAAFAASVLVEGEDPWLAAERGTQDVPGLESARILRLGGLEPVETPAGARLVPCVGALPSPGNRFSPQLSGRTFVAMPLRAILTPRLAEHRSRETADGQEWFRVLHIGSRQIADPAARIIENLLERISAS